MLLMLKLMSQLLPMGHAAPQHVMHHIRMLASRQNPNHTYLHQCRNPVNQCHSDEPPAAPPPLPQQPKNGAGQGETSGTNAGDAGESS